MRAMAGKGVFAAALAVWAQAIAAAEMPFQGSTSGFFTDPTTAAYLGFAGGAFDPSETVGGSAALGDLGTFTVTLPPANPAIAATGSFNLTITFTIPDGASPVNPIVAAVSGTINKNNANDVHIDFGAGQTINYSGLDGDGSFFFTVDDVIFPNASGSGAQQTLTGHIANAVFSPAVSLPDLTPEAAAPEPGTLALLGLGLAGLGAARRRRP